MDIIFKRLIAALAWIALPGVEALAQQQTGALREPIQVSIVLEGKVVGSATVPKGNTVRIVQENGGRMLVSNGVGTAWIEKAQVALNPAPVPVPAPPAIPRATPEAPKPPPAREKPAATASPAESASKIPKDDPALAFVNPEFWSRNFEPRAGWRIYSSTETEAIYSRHFGMPLFGTPCNEVKLSVKKNADGTATIQTVEITYMEIGTALISTQETNKGAVQAKFICDFQSVDATLRAFLKDLCGEEGDTVAVGKTSYLRQYIQEYHKGDVCIRLIEERNKFIQITLGRAEGGRKGRSASAASGGNGDTPAEAPTTPDRETRIKESQNNVKTLPNGDVVIQNIPMYDQGRRGICAIAVAAMVANYYHLPLNVDKLVEKGGYNLKDNSTNQSGAIKMMQAIAQEGKLRFLELPRLGLSNAKSYLDRGYPLIVWHTVSEKRLKQLEEYMIRFDLDPHFELPPASADRKNWALLQNGPVGGHGSLITGYNKLRGEYIYTDSWGEENRNKRMRTEELEATTFHAFVFTP